MNKKEFLEKLFLALHTFVLHASLIPELLEELKQSGNEKAFLSVLVARLKFLHSEGVQATVHKEFEPISGGIYSLHAAGRGFNIRILYGFLSDQRPALLMAFHERAGHHATDYSGKIPVALSRLKDLEVENHESIPHD